MIRVRTDQDLHPGEQQAVGAVDRARGRRGTHDSPVRAGCAALWRADQADEECQGGVAIMLRR